MSTSDSDWIRPEGPWIGHSHKGADRCEPLLEDAIRDAYGQAKNDGYDGWLRVEEIWLRGENPISEYRIKVVPTG